MSQMIIMVGWSGLSLILKRSYNNFKARMIIIILCKQ